MSKSQQERFVKLLSEAYLGTSFLSWSEQVATKSGNDDPGDGFWVSKDVIVAMWMKSFNPAKTKEITEARQLKKVADNLRQAKGSLRAWSGPPSTRVGRPFKIVNEEIQHTVAYDETLAVVVLNFVDSEFPRCFKHDPADIHPSVCLAVTITSSLFHDLLSSGASMMDICIVLSRASWGPDGVSEASAKSEFESYLDESFEKGAGKRLYLSRENETFQRECLIFRAARGGVNGATFTKNEKANEQLYTISAQLHDITHEQVTALVVTAQTLKTQVRLNPRRWSLNGLQCGSHVVFIHVGSLVSLTIPQNSATYDKILEVVGKNVCFNFLYAPPVRDFLVSITGIGPDGPSALNSYLLNLKPM